jgi:hypothetical protein
VKAGDTYLVALVADEHLWMIISDPALDPDRVLMVNFSTWKPYHDQACVVDRGDHPFLKHRTCVNYPEARVTTVAALEHLVTARQLFPQPPLSEDLLRRVRESARGSRIRLAQLQILIDQGLVD